MFWFDKNDDRSFFIDARSEVVRMYDGRVISVSPDEVMDFRNLSFDAEAFEMVIFDPPHLLSPGPQSWLKAKYGSLHKEDWKEDISKGFSEGFRVLKKGGSLIFKWNEIDIPVREILKLTDFKPVVGHRSGKNSKTHWICFLK